MPACGISVPLGVFLDDLVAGASGQQLLVLLLEPGEAGPVDADEPEDLRSEASRRVVRRVSPRKPMPARCFSSSVRDDDGSTPRWT